MPVDMNMPIRPAPSINNSFFWLHSFLCFTLAIERQTLGQIQPTLFMASTDYLNIVNVRLSCCFRLQLNLLIEELYKASIAMYFIVDMLPDQTMTCAPGTQAYLPPEALEQHPKYGSKIDIFSFGHLSLYTAIQVFPMATASTYVDPVSKVVVACPEVERRQQFIDMMKQQPALCPLKPLIVECLDNDPERQHTSSKSN